jgi:putative DNA primase/helicase
LDGIEVRRSGSSLPAEKKDPPPPCPRQIQDSLLIPLQDARGDLWNLQFIHSDGQKRFLKGGRTRGLFTVLESKQETGRIYIGEGFATMATVHELTARDSVAAFSAGNLPAVASTIRKHFPKAEIVLVADADEAGERCSEQAARAISGSIAYSRRP